MYARNDRVRIVPNSVDGIPAGAEGRVDAIYHDAEVLYDVLVDDPLAGKLTLLLPGAALAPVPEASEAINPWAPEADVAGYMGVAVEASELRRRRTVDRRLAIGLGVAILALVGVHLGLAVWPLATAKLPLAQAFSTVFGIVFTSVPVLVGLTWVGVRALRHPGETPVATVGLAVGVLVCTASGLIPLRPMDTVWTAAALLVLSLCTVIICRNPRRFVSLRADLGTIALAALLALVAVAALLMPFATSGPFAATALTVDTSSLVGTIRSLLPLTIVIVPALAVLAERRAAVWLLAGWGLHVAGLLLFEIQLTVDAMRTTDSAFGPGLLALVASGVLCIVLLVRTARRLRAQPLADRPA